MLIDLHILDTRVADNTLIRINILCSDPCLGSECVARDLLAANQR